MCGIPREATEDEVLEEFSRIGRVVNVDLMRDEGVRFNKGRAFVEFVRGRDARTASTSKVQIKGEVVAVSPGINAAASRSFM